MLFTASICILGAYLIGAIPFGLLLSRGSNINIRTQGSKNIGATNVARLLGKKMGALTLCCDVLKGYLPICIASLLLHADSNCDLLIAACGAATVLGHMFPVYLRFKGGKGVATALGVFLYLEPLATLACLVVFVVTVFLSGYVSLGSLLGSIAILVMLSVLQASVWKFWLAGFIVLLIWLKHHQNINRLLNGMEKRWQDKGDK
jgi:acyl-phosphate glycerol 3-phosphate acyltransferase